MSQQTQQKSQHAESMESCKTHSQVGSYQLTKVLGQGSYAVVRLGIHVKTGEKVAVKLIPKARMLSSPDLLTRLEREVAILRKVDHPNVTKLIDFFESEQHFVIVMEFVDGGDLCDLLEKVYYKDVFSTGLSNERIFSMFYQLLCGLEHCHACGIVHRDIKPQNILLDKAMKTVKLTDFGFACHSGPSELLETRCGTPLYASPEVIRGDRYDGAASDVWSLGVLLYGMCAGRLPFYDESVPRLMKLILAGKFDIPSHFDKYLFNLIVRMLHPVHKYRITLSEIKRHPWWLKNCASLKLNPLGINSAETVLKALQKDSTPSTPTSESSSIPTSPVAVNPLISPSSSCCSSPTKLHADAIRELQAAAREAMKENQRLREIYANQLTQNASSSNQEEPIVEPFDTDIIELMSRVPGWEKKDVLKKHLKKSGSSLEKACYHFLMHQKQAFGSLSPLQGTKLFNSKETVAQLVGQKASSEVSTSSSKFSKMIKGLRAKLFRGKVAASN